MSRISYHLARVAGFEPATNEDGLKKTVAMIPAIGDASTLTKPAEALLQIKHGGLGPHGEALPENGHLVVGNGIRCSRMWKIQ